MLRGFGDFRIRRSRMYPGQPPLKKPEKKKPAPKSPQKKPRRKLTMKPGSFLVDGLAKTVDRRAERREAIERMVFAKRKPAESK